jgi:membrane-associated phospholipid phosphatase
MLFLLITTCVSVTIPLKKLIGRPRPQIDPEKVKLLRFNYRGEEKHYSMPSGDSMQSAAFWTVMCLKQFIPWYVAMGLTMCTMTGRVFYC